MAAKLRKASVPYNRQPPSGTKPSLSKGLNKNLLYAGITPNEPVWTRTQGQVKPGFINSAVLGSATNDAVFGKTYTVNNATNCLNFAGCAAPAGAYSVMVCFQETSVPGALLPIISFGGTSGGGGWTLRINASNQLELFYASVAAYPFTGLTLLQNNRYVAVVTVTGNGGTAIPYIKNYDNAVAITLDTPLTVGTQAAPQVTLSIGGDNTASAWNNFFGGAIGAYAVWDRVLTPSEALGLLSNPFQVWDVASPSNQLGTDFSASITSATGTSASGLLIPNVNPVLAAATGTSASGIVISDPTGLPVGVVATSAAGALIATEPATGLVSATGTGAAGGVTWALANFSISVIGVAGSIGAGSSIPSIAVQLVT